MKVSFRAVLSKLGQGSVCLRLYGLMAFVSLFFGITNEAYASSRVYELPKEITSDRFVITIDGKPAAVAHAAENYYFLNFDLVKTAVISITAPSDDYWAKGVEV